MSTTAEALSPIQELRKLSPYFFAELDKLKTITDKVAMLRTYEIRSQREEILLQALIDSLEGIPSFGREEMRVRNEITKLQVSGKDIQNPQEEAEWEAKLEAARAEDRKVVEAERARRDKQFQAVTGKIPDAPLETATPPQIQTTNDQDLSSIKGLGELSIQKLNAAGIKTAVEFHALSYDQKKTIIGPVVANRFK